MGALDDYYVDASNGEPSTGGKTKTDAMERWMRDQAREAETFTAPNEGELLRHGFTQLPTAAAKLRPLHARCTGPRRAVIGQYVDGYFYPEAIFLFDHRKGTREEQFRVIGPDGEVYTGQHQNLFSEADIAVMVAEAGRYRWPEPKPFPLADLAAYLADNRHLLDAFEEGRLFTATTPDGTVQLVQVRRDPAMEDGTETSAGKYVSWHHSDNGWMRGEPDGERLAFACGHLLANAGGATVFVHEGISTPHRLLAEIEKVRRGEPSDFLDDHPLRAEILDATHVGYLGGAGWPQRADWDVLRRSRVARIVIVPDNDGPGRGAVNYISRRLSGMKCTWLQFTNDFPKGFDLSDPWPDDLFTTNEDGGNVYRVEAPRYTDLEHPASWLTRQVGVTAGRNPRPIFGLHPGASDEWVFVSEMSEYYNTMHPLHKGVKADTLNRVLRRFSDVKDTVALLDNEREQSVAALTYRPGKPAGPITEDGLTKLNQYVPPRYAPAAPGADVTLWFQFLEHLFPSEPDRQHIMRWIATLVARPATRMEYGLLLQSTMTGTGKSTLSEIATRLVGRHNASAPSSQLVVDHQFTGWLINKRLVTVHEIYEGASWKAANKLKALVTERSFEANAKNQATYTAPLWAHFICCSNNTVSLRIDNEDRRWFIPTVTEEKLPTDFARALYRWLDGPGIPAIARWAMDYGDYVSVGTGAPMTERKKEQIRDSFSDAQLFALDVFERMAAQADDGSPPPPWVVGAHEILAAARLRFGEIKDRPVDIASVANSVPGIVVARQKVRHGPKATSPLTYSIRNQTYGADTEFHANLLFDLKGPM